MKQVIAPKSDRIVLDIPSRAESLAKVRKVAIRTGQTFRDKVNDYKRKPKHFKGWG